ncbi:MAG: DUF3006 domain-containing protein [Nitriliruptor sp.]
MDTGPSGIGLDRAVVNRIEGDTAVLFVGPGSTAVQVEADALPDGAGVGTWLVMDLQSVPPLPLFVDEALTRARRDT